MDKRIKVDGVAISNIVSKGINLLFFCLVYLLFPFFYFTERREKAFTG